MIYSAQLWHLCILQYFKNTKESNRPWESVGNVGYLSVLRYICEEASRRAFRFTLLNKISCIITSSFLALEFSLFLHISLFPSSTPTLISRTTHKLLSIFLLVPQPLHNVMYMYILVHIYFYTVYIVTVFYEIFYPAYFLFSPFR